MAIRIAIPLMRNAAARSVVKRRDRDVKSMVSKSLKDRHGGPAAHEQRPPTPPPHRSTRAWPEKPGWQHIACSWPLGLDPTRQLVVQTRQ